MQVRKPDDATLAFLLGLALGVMLTLSVVEMWVNNAMQHGWLLITIFFGAGGALYYFAQPYFPEFDVRSPGWHALPESEQALQHPDFLLVCIAGHRTIKSSAALSFPATAQRGSLPGCSIK